LLVHVGDQQEGSALIHRWKRTARRVGVLAPVLALAIAFGPAAAQH